ncbi:hypothetical protein ABXS69_00680 [Actinomyces timonensis]|uniref:Translation initiation factor IF-2 n=1 Tax=Actinomyces timonensis TaxID=1288391 RepID=A0AAU8N4W2_9ACTO
MSESRGAATAPADAHGSEDVGTWAPMGWEPADPGFGDDPFGSVLGDPLMGSPLFDDGDTAAAADAPGSGDRPAAADGVRDEPDPAARALAAQQAQQAEELRAAAQRYLDQAASPQAVAQSAGPSGPPRPRAAARAVPPRPPARRGLPPQGIAVPYGHDPRRATQRVPGRPGGGAPTMPVPRGAATPGVVPGARPQPRPARGVGSPSSTGKKAQGNAGRVIGFIILLIFAILSFLR